MKLDQYINPATFHSQNLLRSYAHLLNSAGDQKGKLLVRLGLAAISALLFGISIALLYPFFISLETGSTDVYWALGKIIVLLLIAILLRMQAETYDTKGYSNLAIHQLRTELGEKLRRVPLVLLSGLRSGEINAVLVQSINEAAGFAFTLMNIIVHALCIPLGAVLALLFLDGGGRFALLICLLLPLIAPLYLWRRKAFRRGFSILAEANSRLKAEAVEFTQGLTVLKSTQQLSSKQNQFNQVAEDVAKIQQIGTKKGEIPNLIITSSVQFALLVILLLGSIWVITGSSHWLMLATIMILIARVSDVLNFFVQMASLLEMFMISSEKLAALMALPELSQKQAETLPTSYDICYENVHFTYPQQKTAVLNQIDFCLPEKTLTAFVGSSGCGKSTLLKLLLRHGDPEQGRITIGGVDIRHMSQSQLMSLISVVFQDVYLFQDSVLNNIRMAKPDADDKAVIEAAKLAQCHDFISQLPQGYATQVSDIGTNFSGGEKQRLAIARAILKDAPILLLDEPTAALDTYNELAVQQALNALVKDKTILIIAHRLSTIVAANQIYVLDKGNIAEQGTHPQLLAKQGIYARFWQKRERL
ncbi:ABC transporter ATP-binding protein [Lonepinella koalarum]|uniref:ABC transporter ATP-binding protein n=1 Tax=Lonepinella koalarum TaxID=53417 RepID=UPI0011E3EF8D|nr:ABC transporter ATP-binding protein [Lonepinella koalarum]TYG33881.1 ABC transporter ATP-binding protein [Lonepinella koalarum]